MFEVTAFIQLIMWLQRNFIQYKVIKIRYLVAFHYCHGGPYSPAHSYFVSHFHSALGQTTRYPCHSSLCLSAKSSPHWMTPICVASVIFLFFSQTWSQAHSIPRYMLYWLEPLPLHTTLVTGHLFTICGIILSIFEIRQLKLLIYTHLFISTQNTSLYISSSANDY